MRKQSILIAYSTKILGTAEASEIAATARAFPPPEGWVHISDIGFVESRPTVDPTVFEAIYTRWCAPCPAA